MATIASLNVLLGINSAQFQRGLARSTGDVRRFQGSTQRSFAGIRTAYLALAGTFAAGALTRGITDAADTLTNINNQIQAAGVSADQLETAQRNIVALADDTRASLQATGGLYARILRSSRELGVSQQQALQITRAFQQTLALSGADTSEAAAASLQFGQALASGRLQGDELRSILENNSFFAQEFARELGVGVGALREMGANGQLTSELLADVALRIAPRINQQFQGLTATFAQSGQVLRNRLTLGFGELGEAIRSSLGDVTGLARSIGDNLQAALFRTAAVVRVLAENGEALRTVFTGIAGAIGALLIPRIVALATVIAVNLAQAILFLLSPVGLIIGAIAAIGTVGALAFEPLAETAAAVWNRIQIGADQLGLTLEAAFLTIRANVVEIFEAIANSVLEAINFAIDELNSLAALLGRGPVAGRLELFDGASTARDRLAEIRTELEAIDALAATANMAVVAGVTNVGGALGDAVDMASGLIDELLGAVGGTPGNPTPSFGGGETGTGTMLPTPEGMGLAVGDGNPFELTNTQQDDLGQSLTDGLNEGIRSVLRGEGGLDDAALGILGSLNDSITASLADNFTNFITDQFEGFFMNFGENVSGFLSDLGSETEGGFSGILSSISGLFGGGGGLGGLFGLFGGFFHQGGIVPGRSGQEVPIVAQAGEAVLTEEQQANLLNGNAGSQTINQTLNVTGDVTEATRRAVREMGSEIANNTQAQFQERGLFRG